MSKCVRKGHLLTLFVFIFFSGRLLLAADTTGPASEPDLVLAIEKQDRILIFAPHPDDETIGAAGIIQKALNIGAEVYVACYTNGDANELSFIMYEKRLTFLKGEFVHMGEVRRKESISALNFLGVDGGRIFFLGYPDLGTLPIMLKYWGKTKPYKSVFSRVRNVPYRENLSPDAPYCGESVLKDIKTVLLKTKPTKIFVSHPIDTNGDHQSLYLFLQVSLWDLEGKIKRPDMYPYLVHSIGWPRPRGFHPDLELLMPKDFIDNKILWQRSDLTSEETQKKYDALQLYKSQIPYNPHYLATFARKNELFGGCPEVVLKDDKKAIELDWQNIDSKGFLSYAKRGDMLYIKLSLDRAITKAVATSINLLGYSKKRPFSGMPKLRLVITRNRLTAYDKRNKVFINDAEMDVVKDSIIVKFPLVALNSPDYILARVKANTRSMPTASIGWRIVKILK
jgi:LmbE family N-acetylglucosaminyl deacetylase